MPPSRDSPGPPGAFDVYVEVLRRVSREIRPLHPLNRRPYSCVCFLTGTRPVITVQARSLIASSSCGFS